MFLVLKFFYSKKTKKQKKKHNTVNIYSCSLNSYKGYETKLAKSHDAMCYIHKLKKISYQCKEIIDLDPTSTTISWITLPCCCKSFWQAQSTFSVEHFLIYLLINSKKKWSTQRKSLFFFLNQHIHGIKWGQGRALYHFGIPCIYQSVFYYWKKKSNCGQ